jgi:hypothetical protein
MRSKRQLTEEILKTIPEESRPSIEMASKKWWVNLRDAGGLRLTDLGYKFLTDIGTFEKYQIPIPAIDLNQSLLLALDKKLQFPYYIKKKTKDSYIAFFSSKEATLVGLYGDIAQFLSNYGKQ